MKSKTLGRIKLLLWWKDPKANNNLLEFSSTSSYSIRFAVTEMNRLFPSFSDLKLPFTLKISSRALNHFFSSESSNASMRFYFLKSAWNHAFDIKEKENICALWNGLGSIFFSLRIILYYATWKIPSILHAHNHKSMCILLVCQLWIYV